MTNQLKADYTLEKVTISLAFVFISFGFGLMVDGKKMSDKELEQSTHVDYRSTLNPYRTNVLAAPNS